jgi:hypothetical protein
VGSGCGVGTDVCCGGPVVGGSSLGVRGVAAVSTLGSGVGRGGGAAGGDMCVGVTTLGGGIGSGAGGYEGGACGGCSVWAIGSGWFRMSASSTNVLACERSCGGWRCWSSSRSASDVAWMSSSWWDVGLVRFLAPK